MSELNIPVLKPEIPMANPNEPQPRIDEAASKLYLDAQDSVLRMQAGNKHLTGFLIDDKEHIATSAHNIIGSTEQFAFDRSGRRYKLEIEKMDDLADIAILKIKSGEVKDGKPLTLGSIESVNVDDKVFAVSYPHEANSKNPYLSTGYVRGIEAPMELMSHIDPKLPEIITEGAASMKNPSLAKEAQSFFLQPLLAAKLHLEAGSGGAPVLDEKGHAVGFVAMSDVSNAIRGETLVAPAEYIKELKDVQGKFEFKYGAKAAPWAEKYLSDWHDDKVGAISSTALAGGAAFIGYRAAMRFPTTGSALLGAYVVTRLGADLGGLLQSTDSADLAKFGLATASDLGTVGGAAMTLVPRLRPYGLALAGVGLLGRSASDFVQNHWTLEQTSRLQGDPKQPPFRMDGFIR